MRSPVRRERGDKQELEHPVTFPDLRWKVGSVVHVGAVVDYDRDVGGAYACFLVIASRDCMGYGVFPLWRAWMSIDTRIFNDRYGDRLVLVPVVRREDQGPETLSSPRGLAVLAGVMVTLAVGWLLSRTG